MKGVEEIKLMLREEGEGREDEEEERREGEEEEERNEDERDERKNHTVNTNERKGRREADYRLLEK